MMAPYFRLLKITMLVFIAGVFALFILHFLGSLQSYGGFEHPFFKLPNVVLADGGDQDIAPLGTKPSLLALKELGPKVIPSLPLHMTADQQWVIFPYERLEQISDGHGVIETQTWEELSKLDAAFKSPLKGQGLHLLRLDEYLAEVKPEWVMLDVRSRSPEGITPLLKVLNNSELKDHVLIKSAYPQVAHELRKEKAMWLFAADQTSIARWQVMAALFILNVADIRADFIITTDNPSDTAAELKTEFLRRNKFFFIKDNSAAEPSQLKDFAESRGIMTTRPSAVVKMLSSYTK